MPLASSKSSLDKSAKTRLSFPSTIDSSTKVDRTKAKKRRASLKSRSREPSPAPKGKENDMRSAPSSPGPTPYWKVAEERGHASPPQTRSGKKKPRLPPPFAHANRNDPANRTEGNLVLTFSPPDQKANQEREQHDLHRRLSARDSRVSDAQSKGKLLLFSPSTGRPLQTFVEKNSLKETAQQSISDAQNAILLAGVGEQSDAIKNLQVTVNKLLESKSFDESEGKMVSVQNQQLQEMREETKQVQAELAETKERLLVDTTKLQGQLDALSQQLQTANDERSAAVTQLEEQKSKFLVDKTSLERDIAALQREANIRLEGVSETRKGLEEQLVVAQADKKELSKEVGVLKHSCSNLELQNTQLKNTSNQLEEHVNSMTARNQQLEAELTDIRAQQAMKGNELESKLAVISSELSAEKKAAAEAQAAAKQSLLEKEESIQQLKTEIQSLNEQKEDERTNFQKLNEVSSKAFEKLQQTARDNDADKERMMQELAGDLEAAEAKCDEMEIQLGQVQSQQASLESELSNAKAEMQKMEHLQTDREHEWNEKSKQVEAELLKTQTEKNALDSKLGEAEDTFKERMIHLEGKLEKRESDFLEKFEDATNKIATTQAENSSLTKRLNQAEANEADLKKRESELLASLDDIKTRAETLGHNLDLTNAELSHEKEQVRLLSSGKDEAISKHSEASAVIAIMKKSSSDLTEQVASLRESLQAKQVELSTIIGERDEVQGRVATYDEREAELFRKLVESDKIRKELHNKVMQLSGNIRVYVRVRPALPNEAKVVEASNKKRKHAAIEDTPFKFPNLFGENLESDDVTKNFLEVMEPYKDRGGLSERRKKWRFGFDNVFTPTEDQNNIWEATEPLVQSAIDGYNVCVFAYGQTGSGKTFTMLGDTANPGLITRAVTKLFDTKKEIELYSKGKSKVSISVELLEIYNEQVRDLLSPDSKSRSDQNLKVTSDNVVGNILVKTDTPDEVMEILEIAQGRRCVKATNSNAESSRSHMVFTVHFNVKSKDGASKTGKLHICDLAGSERLGKSGANNSAGGSLLSETKAINSSLSVLSNVIEKLQQSAKNVPYRESKLTMLLQNSLGGNAKTLAIVCCNPLASHFHESLCSLRFAEKVNKVELKAISNFRA